MLKKSIAVYVRVSSRKQEFKSQEPDLKSWLKAHQKGRAVSWHRDTFTGRTMKRPGMAKLEGAGVEFVSIRDGINARSATGRLMRTILAAFAEYEHEVISERIIAGVARAKAAGITWKGRQPGTRTALTRARMKIIRTLLKDGTSKTEIARQLGISRSTVYEAIELLER